MVDTDIASIKAVILDGMDVPNAYGDWKTGKSCEFMIRDDSELEILREWY